MGEGGAGDFVVELSALEDVLRRVGDLRTRLDEGGDQRLSPEVSGSPPLSGAVDDFVGRWDDGRARIRDNLETIVGSLAATIEEYRSREANNTVAFDGGPES